MPGGYLNGGTDDGGPTTLVRALEPSDRIKGSNGHELWLALNGGPSWGGCRIWISLDNVNFAEIGTQEGASRAGTLTTALAAVADPDTTSTLSVSVAGVLGSGTQYDADNNALLCSIEGELISYEDGHPERRGRRRLHPDERHL